MSKIDFNPAYYCQMHDYEGLEEEITNTISQSNHQLLEGFKEYVRERLDKAQLNAQMRNPNIQFVRSIGETNLSQWLDDYLESKIQNPEGLDSKEGLTSKEEER